MNFILPLVRKSFFFLLCLFTFSCTGVKNMMASKAISKKLKHSPVFSSQFTGFALFDPETETYLNTHHQELLFTPASNTKILSALAALSSLPDSLPAYYYYHHNDTSFIIPLGDPTLLHPEFPNDRLIERLSLQPIHLLWPANELEPYGAGWAWDDFQYSFQNERSWFPLYGNEVLIIKEDSLEVIPRFFEEYIQLYKGQKPGDFVSRSPDYNLFNVWMESDTSTFERKIPLVYTKELATKLLSDTTHQAVSYSQLNRNIDVDSLQVQYSQPTKRIVAIMMLRSDNFLAEQLLIQSGAFNGFYNTDAFRERMLQTWGISQEIKWVDGSGLSRYNLISPQALVEVLNLMFQQYDFSLLQQIFPIGGKSGTLKNWYAGDQPYVFAKTGTLSNNHNLSGFIKTKSGKILIFSMMNNHYLHDHSTVKREMEKLLQLIRDRY